MKVSLVTLGFALCLACAPPGLDPSIRSRPSPQESAHLVLACTSNVPMLPGTFLPADLDGKPLGKLRGGTVLDCYVAPGIHTLQVMGEVLALDAAEGKTQRFTYIWNGGMLKCTLTKDGE